MRTAFYLLAIIALIALGIGIKRFAEQLTESALPTIGTVKGFEDNNGNDKYGELVGRFKMEIKSHSSEAEKNRSRYFWMSFLVLGLTAAATLVSSVQAAKKPDAEEGKMQRFLVIIAIITFASTLASFGSNHFNDRKTEEDKKVADLITMRNQFYADNTKASAEEKNAVVEQYIMQLP